jgi:hypothetical protein
MCEFLKILILTHPHTQNHSHLYTQNIFLYYTHTFMVTWKLQETAVARQWPLNTLLHHQTREVVITVKYGPTRLRPENDCGGEAIGNCKRETCPLVREGTPDQRIDNCLRVIRTCVFVHAHPPPTRTLIHTHTHTHPYGLLHTLHLFCEWNLLSRNRIQTKSS